ncbi:MAG TPA: hypothetical protein GX711_05500 [Clostridia bacterium]|nr:hypothetical protein [Clostridia bacterium]
MEEDRLDAGQDLMLRFFNLIREGDRLPPNHLMAMLGLYALVNILNLVKPEITEAAKTSTPAKLDKESLMETLNGLLKSQGINGEELIGKLGGKGEGSVGGGSAADLLAALGKNPAAVINFMNLLASAREAMNASKREEKSIRIAEENKPSPRSQQ